MSTKYKTHSFITTEIDLSISEFYILVEMYETNEINEPFSCT